VRGGAGRDADYAGFTLRILSVAMEDAARATPSLMVTSSGGSVSKTSDGYVPRMVTPIGAPVSPAR
jgi:hypothetical protein